MNEHLIQYKIRCFSSAILGLSLALMAPQSFGYALAAKGILKDYGQPVHETITQKAAFDSGYISDFSFQNRAIQHLLEGVRFNDDPEGYLLRGADLGGLPSPALGFAFEFIGIGKNRQDQDATKASHFGEFQFLHAMGSAQQNPEEIKENIDRYAYHCWKMATDPNSFENFKRDYEIVSARLKKEQGLTIGAGDNSYTFDQLVVRRAIELFPKNILFFHATNQSEFQSRALGSLLHVIQDSYAKGHVVRVGWESGDNSGQIRYFQDYSQQDSAAHGDLDRLSGMALNGDDFFKIPGAQAAYERSKQLLVMAKNSCPWSEQDLKDRTLCPTSVYRFLHDEVFALDTNDPQESGRTRTHPDLLQKAQPGYDGIHSGG